MQEIQEMPGGKLAHLPLQFIWILDQSTSMSGEKIQALNTAIRESLPLIRQANEANPNAEIHMRALRFSDDAHWHIETPTPVKDVEWSDIGVVGSTAMGRAMRRVADAMKVINMPEHGLPPVLVLVSDGQPTDDFDSGLAVLMAEPWAQKAVRLAIAIGKDADIDELQKFIGQPKSATDPRPLLASNPEQLTAYIKWMSTVLVQRVSTPITHVKGAAPTSANVVLPAPPNISQVSTTQVW